MSNLNTLVLPEPAGCLVTVEGESHHLDANLECAELWVAEEQKNGAPYVFGYENLYTEQQVRALLATVTGKSGSNDSPLLAGVSAPAAQAVEPYAVLVREIGESSFFDSKPIKPGSVQHIHAKTSPHYDYVELYTAPQAQDVERGEVLVTVSGFTGSGKSAIAGEIEILCRALGLQVDWPDGDPEKNMTHADWTAALEQYKPRVRIVERNVPHSVVKDQDK